MEYDVIVVGAGISGLATADQLAVGMDVMILEAGGRVGGRLRSIDGLDLGASWFWPDERRVAALVDELQLRTHSQFLHGHALYDAPDGVVRLHGNPIDVPASRFSGGADTLADALAQRVAARGGDIVLDRHVHTIEWTDDVRRPLLVTAAHDGVDRTARATHVVLALPPALATSTIEFRPGLPDEVAGLAARTPVWMATTTKTVVQYHHAFWRDAGLSGSAVSHVGPLREIHDLSGPDGRPAALFGFSPTTSRTDPIDPSAVIAQLVRLFGPPAANPFAVHVADWRREPRTAPMHTDELNDYSTYGDPRFAQPMFGGHLHWTATETAPVAPGHIEGALAAAERTVRTIAAAPDPPHPRETR